MRLLGPIGEDADVVNRAYADALGAGGSGGTETIYHGTNEAATRPTTTAPVIWVGTVEPLNYEDWDMWVNPEEVAEGATTLVSTPVLDSASSLVSMSFTGTTLTDVVGAHVAPVCTGKPLVIEISCLSQLTLNGTTNGQVINLQFFVVDENNRQWWLASNQGYVTTTAVIIPIYGKITIPNMTPGRHSFKLACKMANNYGMGQIFGGSFGGDPQFEINLTARELI